MNTTKQIIAATVFAAVSAFTSSAAFAGTTGDVTSVNDNFVPMTSRADVKAGVLAARSAGTTQFVTETSSSVGAGPAFHSSVTREAVRAEARDALHSTRSVQAALDNIAG